MGRPDFEYMNQHGFDSHEQALISMLDKVAKAEGYLAERNSLIAAHEESISELKAQLEQSRATIDMLEQRIADYERAMAPATEIPPPPATEPEPNVKLPESEGTPE